MRIFEALRDDHPLVTDGDKCAICKSPFLAGQRIVLAPARQPIQGVENVPAVPLHATCALRGMKLSNGETIERIKDGNGSPYPVQCDKHQYTLEECGFTD
jgi:hypothetical protein